ncbi:unnamed protein product [[Candida] boidinii]|nr:unnamed protein product [[Candida] boidinii]
MKQYIYLIYSVDYYLILGFAQHLIFVLGYYAVVVVAVVVVVVAVVGVVVVAVVAVAVAAAAVVAFDYYFGMENEQQVQNLQDLEQLINHHQNL